MDDTQGHDISEFLQEFIESQALRRTALTYIASRINESDVEVLKEVYIILKFDVCKFRASINSTRTEMGELALRSF